MSVPTSAYAEGGASQRAGEPGADYAERATAVKARLRSADLLTDALAARELERVRAAWLRAVQLAKAAADVGGVRQARADELGALQERLRTTRAKLAERTGEMLRLQSELDSLPVQPLLKVPIRRTDTSSGARP